MFSCVLGGIGEAAPFSLFHLHQHQHKWHALALPASTPRGPNLFQSTTKALRTQSLAALCWKGGTHMRTCACASQMQSPPPPPASLPTCRTRPSLMRAFHPLAPTPPPPPPTHSPGLLMPFFFADGGRSVEEANTSFGYAPPPVRPGKVRFRRILRLSLSLSLSLSISLSSRPRPSPSRRLSLSPTPGQVPHQARLPEVDGRKGRGMSARTTAWDQPTRAPLSVIDDPRGHPGGGREDQRRPALCFAKCSFIIIPPVGTRQIVRWISTPPRSVALSEDEERPHLRARAAAGFAPVFPARAPRTAAAGRAACPACRPARGRAGRVHSSARRRCAPAPLRGSPPERCAHGAVPLRRLFRRRRSFLALSAASARARALTRSHTACR